jgi:hypothetical protein
MPAPRRVDLVIALSGRVSAQSLKTLLRFDVS